MRHANCRADGSPAQSILIGGFFSRTIIVSGFITRIQHQNGV